MQKAAKGVRLNLAPFFMTALLVACVVLSYTAVQAEVPVVDLGSRNVNVTPARAGLSQPGSMQPRIQTTSQEPLGILYSQMQVLQEEIQMLRGQLEQQQNELQQLKQQQKDNYLDIDKRLSEMRRDPTPAYSSPAPLVSGGLPTASTNPVLEKASYDAAMGLLNANQKDAAVLAFRKHLINYPQGEYAGNSMYWLGQIFLSQAKFLDAEDQFLTLLSKDPKHRKAIDAKFSLGKIYFQQGKKSEAKNLITEVSQSGTPTATLALDFLKTNF